MQIFAVFSACKSQCLIENVVSLLWHSKWWQCGKCCTSASGIQTVTGHNEYDLEHSIVEQVNDGFLRSNSGPDSYCFVLFLKHMNIWLWYLTQYCSFFRIIINITKCLLLKFLYDLCESLQKTYLEIKKIKKESLNSWLAFIIDFLPP